MKYLFTSESVSEGHPDKVCDRISDAVVDLYLSKDNSARTAIETLATTNRIVIAGETSCGAYISQAEIEDTVRQAVREIGYDQKGFSWQTVNIENLLHHQSCDIALGVDNDGAGDQGIMFGYAKKEPGFDSAYMPLAIFLASRILKDLADARHAGKIPGIEPDAKSQITVEYEDGRPVGIAKIVLSTQHADKLSQEEVRETAKKYIFLEYFIVDEGLMWGRILEVLARKAAQGVDVRVMYDGTCEFSTLPRDYPSRLEALGIQCKVFSPVTPFVSTHYNYRDHRKILVIDGQVGFTGGVNLADEYINHIEKYGRWKDSALMLKGEGVRSMTALFLQMWSILRQPEFEQFLSDPIPAAANAKGFVVPYGDCPLDGERVGEMVYMDMLNRARKYVHIITPYLILDGELETALRFAAERGVDVHLILPGKPDKWFVYALAKTHYKALISSGVKISEWRPGFTHAKIVIADGVEAVAGTINLDYRSLYHHFENAVWMRGTDCIANMEADFQDTLTRCRRVEQTKESIWQGKKLLHLAGILLKFIAPLV